ncbi:MAG: pilus assembly protein [Gemmatimonadota bacterium]|jgi:Flp pilus assembly protein TadG|nr:pilus assembly protein [Gemmatimonadota bacterium]MDH5615040.1 pilus assembly protein [Acidimicrobiia bacterium]
MMATWLRRARTDERGAVTSEMAVVMVTFFAGFLMLVVFAGRVGQAENDVRSAAHEAARAATLAATPEAADARAREVVASNLAASGIACSGGITTNVDVSEFQPGGWVTVTVTCNASFNDVASLNVPGSRNFTASASEIIDVFRSS